MCSVIVRILRVSVRFFSPSWSKILKILMVGAVLVLAGVGVGCCAGAGPGVDVGARADVGVGVTSFCWLMLVPFVDAAFSPY